MSRTRKGTKNSTANSSNRGSFSRTSGKSVSKELDRIEQLFYTYATKSSGMIDQKELSQFAQIWKLTIQMKMQAEKQGYFTLDEWRRAGKAFKADKIINLKKSLVSLEEEVEEPSNFTDFYSYAFRYCLTEDKKKL